MLESYSVRGKFVHYQKYLERTTCMPFFGKCQPQTTLSVDASNMLQSDLVFTRNETFLSRLWLGRVLQPTVLIHNNSFGKNFSHIYHRPATNLKLLFTGGWN